MRRIFLYLLPVILLLPLSACGLARSADKQSEQTAGTPAAGISFSATLGGQLAQADKSYSEFVTVWDENQAIQMSVPTEWKEVDGSAWTLNNDVIGARISASADLKAFKNGYSEPGVWFGVSNDLIKYGGANELLNLYKENFSVDCTFDSRNPYADSVFEGLYDIYSSCAGEKNMMVVLSAQPMQDKSAYVLVVLVNMLNGADAAALDKVIETFDVVGELP